MKKERCLINLNKLKQSELKTGYSIEGIKYLFTDTKAVVELPFTRSQFIQELPERQKGMSISGYQPKLSLRLEEDGLQVVSNNGTYILKPSPEEYPYLAENEHATMSVMARLNFVVPPFGLLGFKQENNHSEELAFVIKRYDRLGPDAERVHQEQLDGAMGVKDKYGYIDGKKGISYETAAKFLNEFVSDDLKSKRDLFLRIVYAYILGNNDYHLRNIGIILPNNSRPALAPVYDFVSVVPYPSAFTEYMALPLLECEEKEADIAPGIDSKYGEYIGLDFIILAKGMEINPNLAKKWLIEVVKNHQLIINTYTESHMPKDHQEAVLKYVSRRMTLLAITEIEKE